MNRKTLTAIAVCAVLGIAAAVALRQPEKGEALTDRQRPLAKLDETALDTLTITRAGATTTVAKDGAKFKVTAPLAYAADETAAKSAFEAVAKVELGDLVTENKAKQAEFDVDDAKAVHVVAKSQKTGAVLADLFVGKTAGSGTMVRLAGKDEVWLGPAGLRAAVDRAPADWRDRSITTFEPGDAQLVTVKTKDGNVAIAKKNGAKVNGGSEDKWDLVTSVPKVDKLDNSVPAGIVSAMSALKANDFADGAKTAEAGLDAPALTVTVALKGGKNATLFVGNKKGDDDYYVKSADSPEIFLLKKFSIDRVAKRPLDFKDKQVCDIGEADLGEIAVTHGADSFTLTHTGSAWKATKPAKLELDPGKTPALGGAFKDWKATGFAEDPSPAKTGLAKPRATIVGKPMAGAGGGTGAACAFKVGDETADKQSVYMASATAPKGGDVYLVPKWSIDRLLPKLDDLKKK
jgi:Domain of unknown function (DUF4340)